MNPFTLYSQITLPFHPSPLQPHQKTIITITKRTHVLKPALPCLTRFNHRQNPISKVVRSSMGNDKVLEGKNAALLVNTCITRNLPPALSLEQGLDRIKEAVEELKANPPSCSSGMYKFQLAVPPSAKALNWFCSQPEASKIFPAQTTSSKAYGFLDIEFDTKMSNIKHQSGSFYLLIPHIELDEFDDISFLVATLAWDDSSMCTFSEAVQTFEISFDQARHSCVNLSPLIHSSLPKFNNAEDHRQMVRINALLLEGKHFDTSTLEQGDASSVCSQFSARLSPTLSIGNNMKDEISQASYFTQDCPNINALWASLIVEECVRLGLTYFCVAPGSRSSPLTIAAASHPLTTCIACIDERSLAFHALGYAKGSQKPAVIITSSGTAVSNLFPAVVEASQNFVPMLLLTADRPPELVDVGANQAINQVNHYGNFVRHFFSLPPPTDDVSARYVLTTVDSAVFKATSSPLGPIHINCPFREPLANSPRNWNHDCLSGLDILELIQGAEHGILVFGSIQNEDDVWAALLLAKHLLWPVVVDAQSGLRLRKYLSSFLDSKDILFVDQMDQLLLSDSVRAWMKADVIVQIGSRITGRRISQMIERCSPCPYIMVDTHPGRHDPSQIMTHRIQSTISQFSDCLIKCCTPRVSKKWREFIRGLDMMAAWETSFLISSEQSLTEPYVARKLFEAIRCGSALFFGNSMPVRDADMYGSNWVQCTHSASLMFSSGLPCHWVQVTGNRGASGIDGLISTAIGFAVGCNKRVLLVMGDVSFLHDTNGLALLSQRTRRKPMVILVLNNHGGAIFSQLPVANTLDRSILDQFFYTTHNVSIRDLCLAHGVKHILVQTKMELQDALFTSQNEDADCVVEVESGIDTNVEFHSNLRNFTRQASDHALNILSKLSAVNSTSDSDMLYKISKMEYSLYRVQLNAPLLQLLGVPTTQHPTEKVFVIRLSLEDGSTGFGEVAPLEIHKENLVDVEEQLRFLMHVIEGNTINNILPLLKCSLSSWIWNSLGIPVARRADPTEDIAVIQEVRKKVGQHIVLRADANRKWTYDDAIRFASGVKDCSLQYIEEPVNNDEDVVKFCEETGLAVALDETINSIRENHLQVLQKFNHSGVAAVVIKPSVIGGFENAAQVARWAQQHRKMTIVSAAFESSLGLSSYIQFARYLDLQNAEMKRLMNKEPELCVAHGFGTYKWFKEDVMVEPLNIRYNPSHSSIEADAADAVETEGISFSTNVLETGESIDGSTMVFLHGFLGAGRDWTPVMKAMSGSTRCIAVDLPGHGGSKLQYQGNGVSGRPNLSIDVVVDILCKVLSNLTPGKVILVGYSMGARIALYTALKRSDKVERAVIISGSPGLIDNDARATRKAKDDFRASTLVSNGLEFFMQTWYAEELWASFRSHPKFKQVVTNRLQHDDLHTLGKILSDLSIGRQPSLWEDLKTCKVPLQLIVGEKDAKFKAIAREMHTRISHENKSSDSPPVVEISNAGHAVHLENPLAVITAIRQFMKRTKNT
ncbi:UNVERIFIED_CONTAM: protein PHYLLO, chloroplastic [Sesamum angustifolium]|uniref:Protein PHYLLO, chloroplastic n=1 Tax=Sesamum angustifolium TaxID=2727405 RepID=A0AAW2RMJ6_9LAMI